MTAALDALAPAVRAGLAADPLRVVLGPPAWGMPSASPFGSKLAGWLGLAGVPYEVVPLRGPPASRTGKIPYVLLPDGTTFPDSGAITAALTAVRGLTLDAHLSPADAALSHVLRRTFEESTYWGLAYDRWVPAHRFAQLPDAYFPTIPAFVRPIVGAVLRRQIRATLHGQGTARFEPAVIAERVREDLAAVATFLGDREWYFGAPSTLDAISYGFVGSALAMPGASATADAVRSFPTLVAHARRVGALVHPTGSVGGVPALPGPAA